jgi:hypothetical protein
MRLESCVVLKLSSFMLLLLDDDDESSERCKEETAGLRRVDVDVDVDDDDIGGTTT